MLRFPILAAFAVAFMPVSAFNDGYMNVSRPREPIQIRLAYDGPTGMTVSWNTFTHLKEPTVRYGLKPGSLDMTAHSDVSVTYPTSLTYNNHVTLSNLKPDTTYYYQPLFSFRKTPLSFKTGRVAGDHTPFTMAALVDMGTFGSLGLSTHVGNGAANPLAPGEQTTIQSVSKQLNEVDFVAHPGDIAYADYWLKEEYQGYLPNTTTTEGAKVYEHILNAFYDELQNITSVKPYMVSPGNHDSNCDNGGYKTFDESICLAGQTNFTGYINHWRMPSALSGGVGNFWYSYNHGMAHFIHIDTETDLGHGLTGPDEGSPYFSGPFARQNAQLNFLRKDLASVNRKQTPWVVVFGHRPFYSSTDGNCANCTTAFEPLFHQYGVDLYFCGHSHLYERMAPVYKNKTDPAGLNNPKDTWYILNGAAGHYDGLDTFDSTMMKYSRFGEDTQYSWSKLTFHNCSHMTQQAIASASGAIIDEATLIKDGRC